MIHSVRRPEVRTSAWLNRMRQSQQKVGLRRLDLVSTQQRNIEHLQRLRRLNRRIMQKPSWIVLCNELVVMAAVIYQLLHH